MFSDHGGDNVEGGKLEHTAYVDKCDDTKDSSSKFVKSIYFELNQEGLHCVKNEPDEHKSGMDVEKMVVTSHADRCRRC